jgi:hypothetical protein
MNSLPPSNNRRASAWLSLFAMLMIFIGPLISQAMPMDQHAGMSMDMPMSADMDLHHASAEQQDGTSKADHVLWAKCGYCTLLFGCPALPKALAFFAPAPPRQSDLFSAAPQQGHARQSVFANARSRAPPLSLTR